jgi:uncharacterized protein YifE (UPF0438 family)
LLRCAEFLEIPLRPLPLSCLPSLVMYMRLRLPLRQSGLTGGVLVYMQWFLFNHLNNVSLGFREKLSLKIGLVPNRELLFYQLFFKYLVMDFKQKHLFYIQNRQPFKLKCKTVTFSNDQIEILEKYGHWFQALTEGEIEPITELQHEFIKVAKKEKEPISTFEWAWFKYLFRLEYESQNKHIMKADYSLEDDSFYNRDMAKQQKGMMFKVIRDNHKE